MENIDYQGVRIIFDFIEFFVLCGLAIYTWLSNRHKVTQESVVAVNTKVNDLGTRVTTLETQVENLPSDDDLIRIHKRLDSTGNILAETVGKLKGTCHTVNLISEKLMRLDK